MGMRGNVAGWQPFLFRFKAEIYNNKHKKGLIQHEESKNSGNKTHNSPGKQSNDKCVWVEDAVDTVFLFCFCSFGFLEEQFIVTWAYLRAR